MASAKNSILTASQARSVLQYNPETGKMFWKDHPYVSMRGSEAGRITRRRNTFYLRVSIGSSRYYAHRVAWLLMTGRWPSGEIDHINGNGLDNRWRNLRDVSPIENRRNMRKPTTNSSGVVGVYWSRMRRKWVANISVLDRILYLGSFNKLEDAVAARKLAEMDHGFHLNHGRVS